MAVKYTFQNRATLKQISNDLIQDIGMKNPIFDFVFPIVKHPDDILLRWYIDENIGGQMALRGAGGPPTPIQKEGRQYFETEPGVFGEFDSIDEIELMKLAPRATTDQALAVDIASEIRRSLKTLATRESNRMRAMAWTVARLGQIAIPLPSGGIGYRENYTIETFTPAVLWTNKPAATPLLDLQLIYQLYSIGTSNNYGPGAVAICNTYTKNLLFGNLNPSDWGGRKVQNGTLIGMGDYDMLRMGLELPRLVIWDEGHLDENKNYVLDIPNGEILIVAQRPGDEKPGEFSMTRNAVNESADSYVKTFDYTQKDASREEIPPRMEVHQGFNGGIVLHRPSQIIRMIVG